MAQKAQWSSEDPRTSQWGPYSAADNDALEKSYQGRKLPVKLTLGGATFTCDVKTMKQSNSSGGSRRMKREMVASTTSGRSAPPQAGSISSEVAKFWTSNFGDADSIQMDKFEALFTPMSIDLSTVEPFVFLFHMHCQGCWTVTKDEFLNGMSVNSLAPNATVKAKVQKWIQSLQSNTDEFSDFWDFCFKFSRNSVSAKVIPMEDVLEPMKAILGVRSRYTFGNPQLLVDFLTAKGKPITYDLWKQILKFLDSTKLDCSNYDEDACWSTVIDDFVETIKK